jgi:CO/xanthine dehydrogenase FAD-binding subunit
MTMLPNFSYIQPRAVKDSLEALTDNAVVFAGGTDLLGVHARGDHKR